MIRHSMRIHTAPVSTEEIASLDRTFSVLGLTSLRAIGPQPHPAGTAVPRAGARQPAPADALAASPADDAHTLALRRWPGFL
jgi:hypothetical protein